jgi:transglutaminase-like putative cysteine protease
MNARPFPRIGKQQLGWAIFWALVLTLVFSAVVGMNESIRDFSLGWMTAFGAIALYTGWALCGRQSYKLPWLIGGITSGFLILVLVNSGGYQHLLGAYHEGLKSIRLSLPYQIQPQNLQAILVFLYRLIDDIARFCTQSISWTQSLFQGRTSFNPTIIKTFWGTLLWVSSLLTGWLLRQRKHALIASLPILALLAGILGYTRQSTTGLITALFAILLLSILFKHLNLELKWQKNRVDYSEEIRFDVLSLGIPTIIIIMVIASVLPNIPYESIRKTLNQNLFSRDTDQGQIDDSLGLRITPQVQAAIQNTGVLPRALLIGTGPKLSENLVMQVDTGDVFLPKEVDRDQVIPKYYWFGRSYDIYTGKGWLTSEITHEQTAEGTTIVPADLTISRLLTLKIKKTSSSPSTLYSTGIPQSVDQPLALAWREATGEYYAAQIDALEYQVESPVLEIPAASLQQVNQQAPDIILEHYLQLNEETPQRVFDLAASITQNALRPYDKAKAIETYLRQYEYTLDTPIPPVNRDLVDFFLFDLQRGYCDYFASTMVILARAVDLPARLAVGYSTGSYDHQRQLFVVTEANAHAWPEVYIAPYGWIPFEPTASEQTFTWDENSDQPGIPGDEAFMEIPEVSRQPYWPDLLILLGTIIAFSMIFFFYGIIFQLKEKNAPTAQQISSIHQKTKKLLKRLFFSSSMVKTPLEFQNEIINWLKQHEVSHFESGLIEKINRNLCSITNFYHQGLYTSQPLSKAQVKSARRDFTNLVSQAQVLSLVFSIKGR